MSVRKFILSSQIRSINFRAGSRTKFRCLMLFLFSVASMHGAKAQVPTGKHGRHEIAIGVGRGSVVQLTEGVTGGKDGFDAYPIRNFVGTFSLSYNYFFSSRSYIGLGAGFENATGDWQTAKNTGNNMRYTQLGSFRRNVWSLVPAIGTIYSKSPSAERLIYGYLGIGLTYINEVDAYTVDYYYTQYNNGINPIGSELEKTNNRSKWTAQFCPIGVRVGGQLALFAELGFGYKGFFNGGLTIKFGRHKTLGKHD